MVLQSYLATAQVPLRINSGNWLALPSGQPNPPLALHGGDNLVEIRVTQPDQVLDAAASGYTLLVHRPDPNRCYLPLMNRMSATR